MKSESWPLSFKADGRIILFFWAISTLVLDVLDSNVEVTIFSCGLSSVFCHHWWCCHIMAFQWLYPGPTCSWLINRLVPFCSHEPAVLLQPQPGIHKALYTKPYSVSDFLLYSQWYTYACVSWSLLGTVVSSNIEKRIRFSSPQSHIVIAIGQNMFHHSQKMSGTLIDLSILRWSEVIILAIVMAMKASTI